MGRPEGRVITRRKVNSLKNINTYTCRKCGKKITTEQLDKGTTPFSINCPDCNDDMLSCLYECDQSAIPDMFWFRPSSSEQLKDQVRWEVMMLGAPGLIDVNEAFRLQNEHVEKGGLVLGPDKKTISKWATQ